MITIKINFKGGIISPGELFNILVAATRHGITGVSFGLRQQLLINVSGEQISSFSAALRVLGVGFETDKEEFPNIVSSYPAEEIFIHQTWLSEGVYKDILDQMDFSPRVKINISDNNQSLTPLFTGNINWVASPEAPHFWQLFIRFPKTNNVFCCPKMVYTNDVAKVSKLIDHLIFSDPRSFIANVDTDGVQLFQLIQWDDCICRNHEKPVVLPEFNLPYYEGLNRYGNKYWLGIYRRDEIFPVKFLKDLCKLCLDSRIGQICATPWKSLIIKSIEEKDRILWNRLLSAWHINIRHAANELNFQVEDNCRDGLALKSYLVKRLNADDMRTFGLCVGIKTRRGSEVFSSILVRRKPLIRVFGYEFLFVYDILCAKRFNPNERTGTIFSSNNPKFVLAEQLRCAIIAFYHWQDTQKGEPAGREKPVSKPVATVKKDQSEKVHQCSNCLTVYEDNFEEVGMMVAFDTLPDEYACPLCESPKTDFKEVAASTLGFLTV